MRAYPLSWPTGWPRTTEGQRLYGRFSQDRRDITVSQAVRRIQEQLDRFTCVGRSRRVDPDSIVISTNQQTRLDGMPYSNRREPTDPGAAVYFELDGAPRVIPCDQYLRLAENLAAIAATIDALRTLERHGSGIMERAFTGFAALPNPDNRQWRDVLGDDLTTLDAVEQRFRSMARERHPDKGGDPAAFAELTKARADAREELGDKQ